MQNEFTTCRSCGREVPKTLYCIYCGAALSKGERTLEPEAAERRTTEEEDRPAEPKLLPGIADETYFQTPSISSSVREVEASSATDVELEPEAVHQMDELRNYNIWMMKLCGLLVEERVSQEVFIKIYEEYVEKIEQLSELRKERIADYRNQYEEKIARLKEYKLKQEELKARVAVGQIPDSDLLIRTPEMMESIDTLTREASELEVKLSKLNNIMEGTPPKEVFELEKISRKCIESLDRLMADEKMSDELGGRLIGDLKTIASMLEGAVRDERAEEKELRSELDTLEVRFKIGEITLKEFESKRRSILERLERLWS